MQHIIPSHYPTSTSSACGHMQLLPLPSSFEMHTSFHSHSRVKTVALLVNVPVGRPISFTGQGRGFFQTILFLYFRKSLSIHACLCILLIQLSTQGLLCSFTGQGRGFFQTILFLYFRKSLSIHACLCILLIQLSTQGLLFTGNCLAIEFGITGILSVSSEDLAP